MRKHALAVILCAGGLCSFAEEAIETAELLSFEQVLSKTLEKHYSLNLAQIKLQEAKVKQAKYVGALLPKLRIGAQYTRNAPEVSRAFGQENGGQELMRQVASLLEAGGKSDKANELLKQADIMSRRSDVGEIVINPKHVFGSKLTLEVSLFNGPQLVRALSGPKLVSLEEAKLSHEKAQTIYKTYKSYHSILYLKDILSIKERALANAKKYSQGKSAGSTRAQMMLKEADVKAAEIDLQIALDELSLMMGTSDKYRLDEKAQVLSLPMLDEEQALDYALTNRFDLKAKRQAVEIAKSDGLARFMEFLPVISLEGNANYTTNNKGFLGEHFFYSLSINASLSLFDGGNTLAELKEAALKRQENELSLDYLEKDIRLKINSHKKRLEQLRLKVEAYELSTKASAEALNRLNRGQMDLSGYLKANDEHLVHELELKKAQADLLNEELALSYEAGLITASLP